MKPSPPCCAHSPNARGEWHLLADHLRATAELARQFSEAFDAGELGYWNDETR